MTEDVALARAGRISCPAAGAAQGCSAELVLAHLAQKRNVRTRGFGSVSVPVGLRRVRVGEGVGGDRVGASMEKIFLCFRDCGDGSVGHGTWPQVVLADVVLCA